MDEETQIVFKRILAKEPYELTEVEAEFLRARVSYIGKNSRAKFAEILAAKPAEPEPQTDEEESSEDTANTENEKKSETEFPGTEGEATNPDEDGDEEE